MYIWENQTLSCFIVCLKILVIFSLVFGFLRHYSYLVEWFIFAVGIITEHHFSPVSINVRPKNKMCGYGHPTDPNFC